jgi:single-stranded-DNA-specific exonuclease
LLNFFSDLGVSLYSYIPNRLDEGYGLNPEAIENLAEQGVRLIITVDCGISNKKEIELAKELGIKVVVTDHHQIPSDFEPICPVINPNRTDSRFPFKELSGVGVAFFLVIALRAGLRQRNWFRGMPVIDLKQYLDLVALGTVADMVPLTGQNRIIVNSGMEVMKNTRWPGLKAIQQISGINKNRISSYDLGFKIAPRLNAPGRMENATASLKALTTDSETIAEETAWQLNRMNIQRQQIEGEILEEIEETMISELDLSEKRTIVLAQNGWHRGVLGIVASRLLGKYHRPTLILGIEEGVARGSGRSIDGFNLHRSMVSLGHLFDKFGGHYHAAGCTLRESNIEELAVRLEEIAREELKEEDLIPGMDIEAEISFSELSLETVRGIMSLGPFGAGNPEPLFYSGDITVIDSWIVGQKHLKLKLGQKETVMEAIGFGFGESHPLEGGSINIVFTPRINRWNGHEKIELTINDLELSNENDSKLVRMK